MKAYPLDRHSDAAPLHLEQSAEEGGRSVRLFGRGEMFVEGSQLTGHGDADEQRGIVSQPLVLFGFTLQSLSLGL